MNPQPTEEEQLVHELIMTELLNTTAALDEMRMLYTIIEKKREEINRTKLTIEKIGTRKIRRRGAMTREVRAQDTDLSSELKLKLNNKILNLKKEISNLENHIQMIIARYRGVDVQIISSLRPNESLNTQIQKIISNNDPPPQPQSFGRKRKSKRRSRKRKSKKRKSKKRKSKKRN